MPTRTCDGCHKPIKCYVFTSCNLCNESFCYDCESNRPDTHIQYCNNCDITICWDCCIEESNLPAGSGFLIVSYICPQCKKVTKSQER